MGKTTKKESTTKPKASVSKAAAKPASKAKVAAEGKSAAKSAAETVKKPARKKAATAASIVADILANEAIARAEGDTDVTEVETSAVAETKTKKTAKRPSRKAKEEPDAKDVNREAARMAARYALDKKAANVRLLDLTEVTTMTDFFVVASGDSDRQVKAIAENVIGEMRDTQGIAPWRSEGWDGLQWVLIDFVDFVVHIFQTEARQYYNLERLWADAPSEEIKDEPVKGKSTRKKKETIELAPAENEDSEFSGSGVRVISDFKEIRGRDF